MTVQLTMEDLAALMKKGAGVTVDPVAMADRPDSGFDEWGLDSLGLLGIVGELENRHSRPLPADADRCRSPREFIELVNTSLLAGS
ncbi:acyl carrier protein [Streptomyces sp. NPDC058655]|uniref:acyl carrier protein n=1 Tax=unclassified Streptomyces TaxID=2593676 RepID=UPI00364E5259